MIEMPQDTRPGLARELLESILFLALAGSSVAAVLALVALATGALAR